VLIGWEVLNKNFTITERLQLKKVKVVIFGTTEMATMSHFYLTHDSPYEVAAFTVDRDFMKEETLFGLPVVPFEDIESLYPPGDYKMFVAILFGRVNKTRAEKYFQAKAKGYDLISYVSSKAITWPGLAVGDNCFISPGSVVDPFVTIGNDVIIAGSLIGHHCTVKDHCFLATHSVLLGRAIIEPYCFLGANSTIRHNIVIGRECIIGAGATITKSTRERAVYIDKPAELLPRPSNELSKWLTWNQEHAGKGRVYR
jgi:sugar O-acyltransferase (sialic acid O-acetyltransferase NeuD family)